MNELLDAKISTVASAIRKSPETARFALVMASATRKNARPAMLRLVQAYGEGAITAHELVGELTFPELLAAEFAVTNAEALALAA